MEIPSCYECLPVSRLYATGLLRGKLIRSMQPGILISSTGKDLNMQTEIFCILPGGVLPPLESLSRMSRKVQVRFLGDKGGVTRLSYPT